MLSHRPRTHILACLTFLGCIATAHADTFVYPGASPCNTTLQACINAAPADSVIRIATNALIAENVTITRSLIIEPAIGFTASLWGIQTLAQEREVDVHIRGLSITRSGLSAMRGYGGQNLTFRATNNRVDSTTGSAISSVDYIPASSDANVSFTLVGNVITHRSTAGSCTDAILLQGFTANLHARISNNDIYMPLAPDCAAIAVAVAVDHDGAVIIDRNRVVGDQLNQGIRATHDGTASASALGGTLTAQITNNIVTGQASLGDDAGSIVVAARGYNARVNATVVNNTLSSGDVAIAMTARTDRGSLVTGGVHNNIVSYMRGYGIVIVGSGDQPLAGLINSHNLIYSVRDNFFEPGPGTLYLAPQFQSAAGGDFALKPGSAAINAGLGAALPNSVNQDNLGNPRRNGPIDIGAVESTAAENAYAVPTLSGPAIALLCLLLLAAHQSHRRTRQNTG